MMKTPNRLVEFLSKHMEKAGCAAHDLDHCYRVANLAVNLAKKGHSQNDLDLPLLHTASLLHDVFDSKLYNPSELISVEQTLTSILSESYSSNNIDTIYTTIRAVGYKNILIKDRDIHKLPSIYPYIQDADLLDAIGAIGISRCMAYSGKLNRKLFSSTMYADDQDIIQDITREEYLSRQQQPADRSTTTAAVEEATAIDHFYEKLLRIKDMMITPAGKELAKERHEYMLKFIEQLKVETANSHLLEC